jgi:hypothetical protein
MIIAILAQAQRGDQAYNFWCGVCTSHLMLSICWALPHVSTFCVAVAITVGFSVLLPGVLCCLVCKSCRRGRIATQARPVAFDIVRLPSGLVVRIDHG